MPSFTRKSQQKFVATVSTSDTGKSVMEDATIKIAVNNFSHIGAEKAVLPGKALIIDLFKSFEMILNTPVILRILWLSRMIYGRGVGHWLFSPATGKKPMQKFSEWDRPWHGSTLAMCLCIWAVGVKIVLSLVSGWKGADG
jgi:hypothetical protein